MARRQRKWAMSQTETLRLVLGGACAVCGKVRNLEFDCIVPCGDDHHKMEWSWRLSFYRAQFASGNLQLLCQKCNARKSDNVPF